MVELLAAAQPEASAGTTPPPSAAAAEPAPLNAASDLIISAWNAVWPWINYGVDLADYVLGFIPFGYLIGDQIQIFWDTLIFPVTNSLVVDLVAPVVNAPLNINSYVNGVIALADTTVTSLINLGISEFNYFLGWLIPPIPPLPLTTPVEEPVAAELATEPVDDEVVLMVDDEAATTNVSDEVHATDDAALPAVETTSADTEITEETVVEEDDPTTTESETVDAQGEVRDADVEAPPETDTDELADTSPSDETDTDKTDAPAEKPSTDDDGAQSDTGEGDAGTE
jgi:hypothetical protein